MRAYCPDIICNLWYYIVPDNLSSALNSKKHNKIAKIWILVQKYQQLIKQQMTKENK